MSITAVISLSFNVLFVEPVPAVRVFYVLTVDSALPRPSSVCLVGHGSRVCVWCGGIVTVLIFPRSCICVWLWFFQAQWFSERSCLRLSKSFLLTLLPREKSVTVVVGPVPDCSLIKVNLQVNLHVLSHLYLHFLGLLSTVSVPHVFSM